jgi:azurin
MRSLILSTVLLATVIRPLGAVAPAAPARTVDIIATDDMKYSVTTIAAAAGEQLRVRVTNKGTIPKIAMAHNFVLLKIGTDIGKLVAEGAAHRATDFVPPGMAGSVIAKTALAGAGETVEVTFTVPTKPGSYPYLCTFAGHYQAGMKGTLVVK